jgi:hypothetical protein
MTDERKLADAAMGEQLWSEATAEMFKEDWEIGDQAEYYGRAFLLARREGALSNNELKRMTKEANWLDEEAVKQSGGDIENLRDADYIEAVARRLAHHALKYALERRSYMPRFW